MFVGHYGPAFAVKGVVPRVPLWILFFAVQWMDVCWAILVLAGVEKLRIVPGFVAASNLDLYYMPYTHSLPGSLALSVLLGGIVAWFYRQARGRVFLAVALAVFSHWILDLIVHVPDLPLYDNNAKVGFGLWRYLWPSQTVEFAVLIGGAFYYDHVLPSARTRGGVALWTFVAFLIGMQLYNAFTPASGSPSGFASTALAAYLGLTALAALVDRARRPA